MIKHETTQTSEACGLFVLEPIAAKTGIESHDHSEGALLCQRGIRVSNGKSVRVATDDGLVRLEFGTFSELKKRGRRGVVATHGLRLFVLSGPSTSASTWIVASSSQRDLASPQITNLPRLTPQGSKSCCFNAHRRA